MGLRSGQKSKLFAIGDVHGCAEELLLLLQKLPLDADSTIVFLGDYVDRGPRSREVIDIILALQQQCEVVALKGNHEDMFQDFLEHPESAGAGMFIINGGSSTLASYDNKQGWFTIPESHLGFYRSLKSYYETESYFFVHAGVPEIPLSSIDLAQHQSQLMWIRQPFLTSEYRWEKIVVHGHTPDLAPQIRKNRINLDTGCVYDGHLTAMEFPSLKFHMVERLAKEEAPVYLRTQHSSRVAMRFPGHVPVYIARGERLYEFETLNYNQFGLLIQPRREGPNYPLEIGDIVSGKIGRPPHQADIRGIVVRTETRGERVLYGIKLDRLHIPEEGFI